MRQPTKYPVSSCASWMTAEPAPVIVASARYDTRACQELLAPAMLSM
ncbi:Uncharacterised protein [Mycobacteroides abscessus subsp. massiliense]|nr:Uncharacterised protein [Mycobacteroides abscessus subsp. massiliense]